MSTLLWQEPSKLELRTSATSSAAESGCSAMVPNSVLAVFGAPAPVFPPAAMYNLRSAPKCNELTAWLALARGRPVMTSCRVRRSDPDSRVIVLELASPLSRDREE